MTLPISYFRFYFPEYVLKTRLPPNCATGFLDKMRAAERKFRGSFFLIRKNRRAHSAAVFFPDSLSARTHSTMVAAMSGRVQPTTMSTPISRR